VEAIDFWGLGHPVVPPGQFPEADELRRSVIEIPCHQDLTPATIDRVATTVREVLEEVPA
jgi:dTDP-4-amino-4,6-dideoxygalactose transaminase